MTELVTWTVDRSGLPGDLADLVIDTSRTGTYIFAQGGVGRPGVRPRETLATPSPFVHGQARTAVVKEESTLPGVVLVQGSSSSAVDTAVEALETALWQFTYTVTEVKDGVTKVWSAYPATIGSVDGLVTPGNISQFYLGLSLSIPVYPVSA